jgi:hypothetical protein
MSRTVHHLTALDLVVGHGSSQKPKRQRKRWPTLVGIARQAARAGIEVAKYEVDVDGKITVVTGKADITDIAAIAANTNASEWNWADGGDRVGLREHLY